MTVPALVLAAAESGAGKTTAAMAVITGLRARGLTVQPFKVGPDYLDPGLLSWAAGRRCRNLDAWMVPEPHLLELFHRACSGADIAVVEGVMGLFDGKSGGTDAASTAAVARLLDAAVVLVVDAASSSRTVGAVALGLTHADPRVHVAGAVLNRVVSERHRDSCVAGLDSLRIRCFGHLLRQQELVLPERYLGLVSPAETEPRPSLATALRKTAATLDLDGLVRSARPAASMRCERSLFPAQPVSPTTRIAMANDRAFHFYYRDSLDLLEAWGAELVPFSPLQDTTLPAGIGGVFLGGGYPELFAAELAANQGMLRSLRKAHAEGALVYAECGGAMYAARELVDADGRRHRMAGLWPATVSLPGGRLSLGYREVSACAPSFLAGSSLHAHEFHRSQLREHTSDQPAWVVTDDGGRREGHATERLTASYIHIHLGAQQGLAARFVDACRPAH